MKFFLDENLSPRHSETLRGKGFDAIGALEVGLAGATDERIRDFAVEQDRVLVTLDADFTDIRRFPLKDSPGVIRLKIHPATELEISIQLEQAISLLNEFTLKNKLAISHKGIVRIRG